VRDGPLAVLLGLLTALSRIPFVTHRLWEWDSVLYARALEGGFHVDDVLAGSRPHPPGYIFYVASAALGKAAGLSSNDALVAVAVVASGVAAAAFYLLCRRFAGRSLSLLVTAAFVADPLLWLHGEVAMPYIMLAPLGTILALAFLETRRRGGRGPVLASALFGALAGFRQDLLLFLLPLWLWMEAPMPWRTRVASLAALGVGCLVWFVPSAALSDGPIAYVSRTIHQFAGLSGVSGNAGRSIAVNLVLVGDSLLWALLAITFPLAVLGLARALARVRGIRAEAGSDTTMVFFTLWLLPALLFYVFVHIGEWGFVTTLVPGLYAMFAWLLRPIVPRLGRAARVAGGAFIAADALLGAALFVFGADPVFSAASLAEHDAATDAKTAYIQRHLAPGATVILAGADVLVARYYAPGYVIWYSDGMSDAVYTRQLDRDVTLVVYEPRAHPPLRAPYERVQVAPGIELEVAPITYRNIGITGVDIDAAPR
jgi:hypothetical protein